MLYFTTQEHNLFKSQSKGKKRGYRMQKISWVDIVESEIVTVTKLVKSQFRS